MSKSRQELIERALQELGVVSAGQTAAAEDAALVEAEIDPVMSDLATRNVWQWGDPDEFEEDAFIHLAKLIGNSLARAYGVQPDEAKRLYCEGRLRLLSTVVLSGQPQRAEYY
jgi:hypothetical protein